MNRTILITGASSGIGRATAHALAQREHHLILAARRVDKLKELKTQLEKNHACEVSVVQLDVQDPKQVESALSPFKADIDIIINNAGLAAGLASFDEADLDDWERMIDTNVKGLLYVTHYLLPSLRQKNRGHIVNIGSIAGHQVYPKGAVYCATKHAVKAITEGLKYDLLGTQVRVTAIDPGMVETEFSLVRFNGDEARAKQVYEGMTPLKAEDVAECIAFAVTRPAHVNICDMIVLATDQASATLAHRTVTDKD